MIQQDNDELLKDACDQVINDSSLMPVLKNGKIVETHCNEGAQLVAQALGCDELTGMMADEQYNVMYGNLSGRWRKVEGRDATLHALDGKLAFAALPSHRLGEAHGHIAAVYPACMGWSNSLKKEVPMVANVGTVDREERASEAFPVSKGEPDYFTWS